MAVLGDTDRWITAPSELGHATRAAFREAAFAELLALSDGGTLRIDLTETRRVDSAGLSALLLIHRRAADRKQRVVLRHASEELRYLLALTQMAGLFELTGDR
jgi:ABC-type transporter Mla MlaB component